MDFTLPPEIEDIRLRTRAFVAEHVVPLEADRAHYDDHENIRLDILPAVRAKIEEVCAGEARSIDTRGRPSGEWGQPWLTRYLRWRRRARARARDTARAATSGSAARKPEAAR